MTRSQKIMALVDDMRRCEWEYGLSTNDDEKRVRLQDYQHARAKLQAFADEFAVLKHCYSPDKVCEMTGEPD